MPRPEPEKAEPQMDAYGHGLILKAETEAIIGCAFEVLNELGHGLLEKPCENALVVEFGLRAIRGSSSALPDAEKRDLIKLIYIDPPFDVGADFSRDIEIGGETFRKEPNLLEQIAYRDTWGRGASRVDVLAFEFEMGLFPAVLEEAKQKGIDLAPKTIPPEVFDQRAVEKGQVRFHDVAYIFENEWQSFRTRQTRDLELTTVSHTYAKTGRHTIAVKVIDIFGNDTMTLVPVTAG